MSAEPKRFFSFSLRTLFVALTLVCCWLGYSLNWIRERHAVLTGWKAFEEAPAPAGLWLLGEPGHKKLLKFFVDVQDIATPEETARVRRLFPEATEIYSAPIPR